LLHGYSDLVGQIISGDWEPCDTSGICEGFAGARAEMNVLQDGSGGNIAIKGPHQGRENRDERLIE
jgi:hypothetical protein